MPSLFEDYEVILGGRCLGISVSVSPHFVSLSVFLSMCVYVSILFISHYLEIESLVLCIEAWSEESKCENIYHPFCHILFV